MATNLDEEKEPKIAEINYSIKQLAPNLHQTTSNILVDMYAAVAGFHKIYGTESDAPFSLDGVTATSIAQGANINALMRDHSVHRSLEIGFAYGFSTVWMLDALRLRNNSLHIAIDPFEKTQWKGIGLCKCRAPQA
jgi:predicted O-methyltransferase YrrM